MIRLHIIVMKVTLIIYVLQFTEKISQKAHKTRTSTECDKCILYNKISLVAST